LLAVHLGLHSFSHSINAIDENLTKWNWTGAARQPNLREQKGKRVTHTLYSMQSSGNCYKPRLLMHLLGLPFRLVETDPSKGETRTPDYLALNPNGKVPLLVLPDGRCLSESNAMLLYLADGTRFLPNDRYQRALAHQWLFFEQYDHEPVIAVARSWMKIYPDRIGKATLEQIADWQRRGNRVLSVGKALRRATGSRRRLFGRRHRTLCLYACGRGRRLRPQCLSGDRRVADARRRRARPCWPGLAALIRGRLTSFKSGNNSARITVRPGRNPVRRVPPSLPTSGSVRQRDFSCVSRVVRTHTTFTNPAPAGSCCGSRFMRFSCWP
jgi:glutathione S-transferase